MIVGTEKDSAGSGWAVEMGALTLFLGWKGDRPGVRLDVGRVRSRSPKITSGTSKLAQRKGLQFYQTRSHAIALFNTLPAKCIEKENFMKTGEDLYSKVFQSPRLPRVVLTPTLQHGRQDLSNPEARTSADHQSEQSAKYEETRRSHLQNFRHKHLEENHRAKYRETCRGNVDYRIQGMLHSTVQKEDSNRKEIVKN